MNQQERDEIRAKHKPAVGCQGCEWKQTLCEECSGWSVQDGAIRVDFPCWFPCWAIKYVDTLDAWEAEKANTNTAHCLCGSRFPCKYQGLHNLVGEPAERIEVNNDHPIEAEKANDFTDEEFEAILDLVTCTEYDWRLEPVELSALAKARAILKARNSKENQ